MLPSPDKRVRASEKALTAALRAMQAAGLSVDRLLITGAQVEIKCAMVDVESRAKNDEGLEQW